MAPEAMEKCLRVLKESNKSRFESYGVRNSELIVSHIITFRDCRVHIFTDNLSRKSCMHKKLIICSTHARQAEINNIFLEPRNSRTPLLSLTADVSRVTKIVWVMRLLFWLFPVVAEAI